MASDLVEQDEAICREARAKLIHDALAWTDWCAGQGICAAKSEGITDPDDLLMEYSERTGDEDWTTLPDRVSTIEAEAYRRGVEDAAKVAERVASVPAEVGPPGATYSGYELQQVFPREGCRIAAAIRALPADKEGAKP